MNDASTQKQLVKVESRVLWKHGMEADRGQSSNLLLPFVWRAQRVN